ncbi:hypothetical protein ACOSQ2_020569 [Xanthoceras sorbifolium]
MCDWSAVLCYRSWRCDLRFDWRCAAVLKRCNCSGALKRYDALVQRGAVLRCGEEWYKDKVCTIKNFVAIRQEDKGDNPEDNTKKKNTKSFVPRSSKHT